MPGRPERRSGTLALSIGAVGIVFGDIGTSVLYAFKAALGASGAPLSEAQVLGVVSLFIWALIVIVAFKYVALVMRADNHGEGGMMALLALASRAADAAGQGPRLRAGVTVLGMFGVALFFGDGVITPAISVLSAVEGLEIATPAARPYVIPITLAVLVLLFMAQRRGTGQIGHLFGPLMVLWFVVIGGLGARQVWAHPQVLSALSPLHALTFAAANLKIAFITLGAVFLCLTGAEALYADMGHFGKRPIRLAWFVLIMPALMLNYLGQGALVLHDAAAIENPFYRLAPPWVLIALVVLATAATVIASQALISGAFSATKQAIQLGFLPRMVIVHTSLRELGQVYVGITNWLLLAGVVLAVGLFRSSDNLAAAYGIAVSLLMVMTTLLTYLVIRQGWRLWAPLAVGATVFFLAIDLVFFSSNALKVVDGGWFPLLIAGLIYVVMSTWKRGHELLGQRMRAQSIDLQSFLDAVFIAPPPRVARTAVFMAPVAGVAPAALMHSLKHFQVLHERMLFVTVVSHEVPWIGLDERVRAQALGHDCWQVSVNYGFKNDFDIPAALELLRTQGCALDPMTTSYFLSHAIVLPHAGGAMAPWREKLFAAMRQMGSTATVQFLNLPGNAVVELGAQIEI
ncbi:potassium transporter Kup [Comamonas badia]|uniref:potassium transporter Kup n=1 Tax=Comamonas badia TaxID=265291 RepID=UPI0003FED614|nr:potassium transporter Kup [Comamonas badia]